MLTDNPLRKDFQSPLVKKGWEFIIGNCVGEIISEYLSHCCSLVAAWFGDEAKQSKALSERCLRVSANLEVWINLDFSQEKKRLNVVNVTGVLCINQISRDT